MTLSYTEQNEILRRPFHSLREYFHRRGFLEVGHASLPVAHRKFFISPRSLPDSLSCENL